MFQRLRFLRNIKWHCADWLSVVLRYTIAKYILWCLDKKHYDRCCIFLIACIVLLVLFHDTLSEATPLFTLIVSMSVTFLSLWKSLTAISFWPNLKIYIFNKHFWTHRMIFWVDISDNQLPDAQRAVLTLRVLFPYSWSHNFSVTHKSHYLAACYAIGSKSLSICSFHALHFLQSL